MSGQTNGKKQAPDVKQTRFVFKMLVSNIPTHRGRRWDKYTHAELLAVGSKAASMHVSQDLKARGHV